MHQLHGLRKIENKEHRIIAKSPTSEIEISLESYMKNDEISEESV